MKEISLELGQKLYHLVWGKGIFTYEVVGVKKDYGKILYELKCENCKDHEPCHLYVTENDDGTYSYFDMINNECHDYWYSGESPYYTNVKDAHKYYCRRLIDYYKNKIEEAKSSIKSNEENIKKLEEELKQLEEEK